MNLLWNYLHVSRLVVPSHWSSNCPSSGLIDIRLPFRFIAIQSFRIAVGYMIIIYIQHMSVEWKRLPVQEPSVSYSYRQSRVHFSTGITHHQSHGIASGRTFKNTAPLVLAKQFCIHKMNYKSFIYNETQATLSIVLTLTPRSPPIYLPRYSCDVSRWAF